MAQPPAYETACKYVHLEYHLRGTCSECNLEIEIDADAYVRPNEHTLTHSPYMWVFHGIFSEDFCPRCNGLPVRAPIDDLPLMMSHPVERCIGRIRPTFELVDSHALPINLGVGAVSYGKYIVKGRISPHPVRITSTHRTPPEYPDLDKEPVYINLDNIIDIS